MKKNQNLESGITLIELLVSIFIIILITSVVVFNHRAFTDKLEITNLAFDIALTIREAQVSGIAVEQAPDVGGFENAFGVSFFIRTQPSEGGDVNNDKIFIRFIDFDSEGDTDFLMYNGTYDCTDSECLEKVEIGRGNKISHICYRNGGALKCGSPIRSEPRGVDIAFLRPKPDASIKFRDAGGEYLSSDEGVSLDNLEAVICLESPLGRKKSVHVLPTGQISVRDGEGCLTPGGGPGGGAPGGGGPGGGAPGGGGPPG
ncbi:MAG: type II secretion system protein [Candidatus Paceibacterota bacterium]|nr:MAG: type II secretion system protein [Candidatus Paceibacterota bacterium]